MPIRTPADRAGLPCLLCETDLDLYWGGFDHTPARREQANLALQHAEQIRPDAGEVHLQKGAYAYHGFRDYDRAIAEFELARRVLPNLALEKLALSASIPAGITYGELKLSPIWDSLRGDPRFDKIVASLAPKEATIK